MVWGKEGPEKGGSGKRGVDSRGREEVLGMSTEGGSRAGRSREGEVEGGGSRKGSTDPLPKLAKRCKFPRFSVQVFGSLVWENHKAEKNASVSHSVRLEKSPWLKKKAPVEKKRQSGKHNV